MGHSVFRIKFGFAFKLEGKVWSEPIANAGICSVSMTLFQPPFGLWDKLASQFGRAPLGWPFHRWVSHNVSLDCYRIIHFIVWLLNARFKDGQCSCWCFERIPLYYPRIRISCVTSPLFELIWASILLR